ncbi:MAG: TonB-dependent receptor plug domain-containing protein, partial [Rhodospirillaceae bacterium]
MKTKKTALKAILLTATCLASPIAHGQSSNTEQLAMVIEEIIVTGRPVTYNNAAASEQMLSQQTPLTSALSVIDNLPGVSIQEGDTFGFDDWSTTVSIRGFQVSLDDQQVGSTIDGLPNGNSNYGGGAKANRYIDSQNLASVEVAQGTADIASLSTEALGGTLNFITQDPTREQRLRVSASIGQFGSERVYFRYDTGELFNSNTYAWVSVSHQEATDWVNGAAENYRDHLAFKLTSEVGDATNLSVYFSYDDTHEDNYQRLFSAADFAANSEWDQLTAEWTGLPYVDQLYRKGWSTLRENVFAYVKASSEIMDGVTLEGAAYTHHNYGRGDWVPPYLVDVRNDGAGNGHSEFLGGSTVEGGAILGLIQFVDANGVQFSPAAGCESSITFPYGGAGPQYDPACHPAGAIPVQSYRHTHYRKQRYGVSADFTYEADFGDIENIFRGGLWYEDTTREEWRDWHKITDTRVGFEFNDPA